jgi:ABC-type transport system involved in multi-copper enzyme maturation permease subunit
VSLLPSNSLLDAELLKVRKRWILYVIFLVMIVGVAMNIWLFGYVTWLQEKDEAEYAFGFDALRTLTPPYSLAALLDSGQFWGAILVGILVSSAVGTEYGWGTVRQAIVRGQSRSGYLTLKLLGLIALCSAILLAALGVGMLFSWVAAMIVDEELSGSISVGEAVLMVLRAGFAIIPYGMLAFALATVGRSTTLGVAGTLVFIIFESIIAAIFMNFSWSEELVRYLPGQAASSLIAANYIDGEASYYSMAPRDIESDQLDPPAAALVIALYGLALGALTYFVFNRRDLGR